MAVGETFERVFQEIKRNRKPFFVVFFIIVLISYAVLYAIDFIPEPIDETQTQTESETELADLEDETIAITKVQEEIAPLDPLPVKITFDSLDKEVTVLNPQSREVADLDAALLSGVVRHPDSATLTEKGNVFILGHSSYLPNVLNKNFQAFNGIQDLEWGDLIRVESDDAEYVYRVQRVYQAKASDVVVPNTPGKAQLTLATCNSFGSKDDRYIVEANLIETRTF